jgi:16S rRNA (cytosine967-C5)-methyltransferase
LFEPIDAGLGEGPYVQLWPHRHGTDAMFAAALRRLP